MLVLLLRGLWMDLCWIVFVFVPGAVRKVRHADVPVVAAEVAVEEEVDGNSFPTEAATVEAADAGGHRVAVRTIWPEELAALLE